MRTVVLGSMLLLSGCLRSREAAMAAAQEALPCPSLTQDGHSARLDQQADAMWNEAQSLATMGLLLGGGGGGNVQEVGAPRRRFFEGCGVRLQCDITYVVRNCPRATCVRVEPTPSTESPGL
ncbi:MAG: hypothetical protein Q8L14_38810 [Myxococcales bacterium]|nr:hypothetical protein [Myxococcales bacterium]